MSRPAESVTKQVGLDASHIAPVQHIRVWNEVLPLDAEYDAEMTEMEAVESCHVPAVACPRLTALQKRGENDCFVDFELGVETNTVVGPDAIV